MTKQIISIQDEYFFNLSSCKILKQIIFILYFFLFYYYYLFISFLYTICIYWITGSILVNKMLPKKRTRHNYVLSVQDWCSKTATLNVTIVTENTVSMNQGKYWGSRMSLISIRLFIVLSYCQCCCNTTKVTLNTINLALCRANKFWSACSWYRPLVFWKTRPSKQSKFVVQYSSMLILSVSENCLLESECIKTN